MRCVPPVAQTARAVRALLVAAVLITASLATPASGAASSTIGVSRSVYGPDPAQIMTVFTPPGSGRRPAVLFVHGGCWQRGQTTAAEMAFARQVAIDTGWVVAAMDYRVTGARWANQPADVAAAMRRLQTGPWPVRPDRTALWGESAGGHLALLHAHQPGLADRKPVGVVSVSGPTDMRTMSAAGGEALLRCVSSFEQGPVTTFALASRYAATSPATLLHSTSPPTYLANAVADPLVPPEQAVSVAGRLRALGVRAQADVTAGSEHSTALENRPVVPGGPTVRQRAIAFLRPAMNSR